MSRVVLALCLLCGVARAHPLDSGYLRIDAEGSAVAITFDLDVTVAGEQLGVPPGGLDPVLATRSTELAAKLYRTTMPVAGGQPCTWGTATATRKGQTVTIAETATCPAGDVRWELTFVKKLSATFQILGKVRAHGVEQVITIDKTQTAVAFAGSGDRFSAGIWDGVAATGVLPRGLPDGLAYVLLVVLLALAAPTVMRAMMAVWMTMVGNVAGAAVAASVGTLPSSVLALALALSITGIAAVAATGKHDRYVVALGASAGVWHGLGSVGAVHWIGYAAGFSLGLAAIGIVAGVPVALARTTDRVQKAAPVIAIVTALGAIALVIKASVG